MNAEVLPIKKTGKDVYKVKCPMVKKMQTEKKCEHCAFLRWMETDKIKCNYNNMKNQHGKRIPTGY